MREESKRRLSESLKGKPSWNKGKSKTGKIPSKEELTKDYLLDKLSREIIRKKYNISGQALTTALKSYQFPIRNWSEARKIAFEKGRAKIWNKDNMHKIKKNCQFCGKDYEDWPTSRPKYCSQICYRKAQVGKAIPKARGRTPWNKKETPQKDILYDLYVQKQKSLSTIAEIYKTNQNTVQRWLKQYFIERRKPFSGRQGPVYCKNGHKLLSDKEVAVCEFLDKHNIHHEINKRYLEGRNRKFAYDFKVDDNTYIEVKGASGNNAYKKMKDLQFKEKERWLSNEFIRKVVGPITYYIIEPTKGGRLPEKKIEKELSPLLKRYALKIT